MHLTEIDILIVRNNSIKIDELILRSKFIKLISIGKL